jgi:hypothetical protein
MQKPKDITIIMQELVDSLVFTFNAVTVTPVGLTFVLTTCNTYWIRPCKVITIVIATVSYRYTVTAVTVDESITLTPIGHSQQPPTGDLFTIDTPTFRHGTAKAINAELTKMSGKTPFIWLLEVINEEFVNERTNPIERNTPVQIFFFDDANPENWFTSNHYSEVIRPLRNLVYEFLKKIDSDRGLFMETKHNIVNLPDWGEFNRSKGFTSKIFDEQWSGIELKKTLTLITPAPLCNTGC